MTWIRADIDFYLPAPLPDGATRAHPPRTKRCSELWAELAPQLRLVAGDPLEEDLYYKFHGALQRLVHDRGPGAVGGRVLSSENGTEFIENLLPDDYAFIGQLQEFAQVSRRKLESMNVFHGRKSRVLDAIAWQMQANATDAFVDAWVKEHGPLSTSERVALKRQTDLRRGGITPYAEINEPLLRLEAACTELAKKDPKTKRLDPAILRFVDDFWPIWRQTPLAANVQHASALELKDVRSSPPQFLRPLRLINLALPASLKLAPSDHAVAEVVRMGRRWRMEKV